MMTLWKGMGMEISGDGWIWPKMVVVWDLWWVGVGKTLTHPFMNNLQYSKKKKKRNGTTIWVPLNLVSIRTLLLTMEVKGHVRLTEVKVWKYSQHLKSLNELHTYNVDAYKPV